MVPQDSRECTPKPPGVRQAEAAGGCVGDGGGEAPRRRPDRTGSGIGFPFALSLAAC